MPTGSGSRASHPRSTSPFGGGWGRLLRWLSQVQRPDRFAAQLKVEQLEPRFMLSTTATPSAQAQPRFVVLPSGAVEARFGDFLTGENVFALAKPGTGSPIGEVVAGPSSSTGPASSLNLLSFPTFHPSWFGQTTGPVSPTALVGRPPPAGPWTFVGPSSSGTIASDRFFPSFSGTTPDPHAIVSRAVLPHELPLPIEQLPDQNTIAVSGTLSAGHTAKVYQLTLDGNTGFVNFELHAQWQAGQGFDPGTGQFPNPGSFPGPLPVNFEITVLDPNGRQLIRMEKGLGDFKMTLSLAKVGASGDSSLFVEISAQATSPDSSPVTLPGPIDFAIDMTREAITAADDSFGDPSSPLLPALSTLAGGEQFALALMSSSGTLSSGLSTVPSIDPVPLDLEPRPVATGPLPTRAVGPLGGMLAVGDPAPQTDGRNDVLVDLDLIGVPENLLAEALETATDSQYGVEGSDGDLVTVHGPGGFPLLASAVRNDARSAKASLDVLPWINNSGEASDPAGVTAIEKAADAPARSPRRVSALTSTSLALVLVVGLMLPELTDTLQFSPLPRFWKGLKRLSRAGSRRSGTQPLK